jgi:hypothetical protein
MNKEEYIDSILLENDRLYKENKELQEKINVYEDPEDLTLMFMYCDEKAKDKIKELHNKIDKAIEYMKNWNDNWYSYCQQEDKENLIGLLEILKDSNVNE